MILNLFSTRSSHPLGDVKEFKRVLAGLPQDSFKAVDEIYGWFESLRQADDFKLDYLHEVVSGLDEAAQPHLRRLARHYLGTQRLSKNDERRLWTTCFNYWGEVSWLYAVCFERFNANPKSKGANAFKANVPLTAARLMAARANQIKWLEYRYAMIGEDMWRGMGLPYLAAEAGGYAQKPVQLYPGAPGTTCASLQYLQALVRESSSLGMLLPLEIEIVDRLVAHFLPAFVFGQERLPGNAYWIDAAGAQPPARLTGRPAKSLPSLRFFQPGPAYSALDGLTRAVERGTVPEDLKLGMECSAAVLLKVLRHLMLYWAPATPQREHVRHPVKTRMAVLQGFENSLAVFAGNVARLGVEQSAESWVVENVSLGGFRAGVDAAGDWLTIGSLLCLQPEGGNNWVLGVVRRRSVNPDSQASIGIQTLSRDAQSIELRPRATGLSAAGAIPGIWLRGNDAAEQIRLVLPPGGFNVRQPLEFVQKDQRHLLTPMELEESGGGFEIGVYREQVLA
ncbi:MAG: hypothetical protein LBI59_04835 [Candidatus Accumulibacter sp.]|jgi:hypothetical protein|nr:hypothetical protein [Accumulibacter sp.]